MGRGALSDYYAIWWSSWIDTMQRLGVDGLNPWEGQQIVAQSAYWWWSFRHFAVLSERPRHIRRDEQGRLHSETGTAIEWPDGWGFHVWHGTRVPEWVIREPTVERAMAETNSEIRRAAFERIGWADAIQALGMERIDVCDDPGNQGRPLALYRMPDALANDLYGRRVNLLLMCNGSPDRDGSQRLYAETVPARTATALEAAAWQYGVTKDVYKRLARRT